MTSLDHPTDYPTETVLWVHCTQCKKLREADTLMPVPFYHPFIKRYCMALLSEPVCGPVSQLTEDAMTPIQEVKDWIEFGVRDDPPTEAMKQVMNHFDAAKALIEKYHEVLPTPESKAFLAQLSPDEVGR